ncbi:sensor histidine kinase [Dactylosporangium sp. AC04546]|uniref:sensor histidine kinase n=1 Tax=Dactylosporangium sp. AC04546 TaxID=2862460 RepID=UPI001EE0B494|nr:sensor histidine kinase [Dactylosporangium sp. AC04546]WVK78891.1 sensor histidine kinase [Dactylosporangium sp. AC04546]
MALTVVTVASAAIRASEAGVARELVAAGGVAARLAGALQQERVSAALVFAEPANPAAVADYRHRGAETDGLVVAFERALAGTRVPGGLEPLTSRLRVDLGGLAGLRQKVAGAPDAVLSVVAFRYRTVIADLVGYREALGQVGVSAATANGLRAAAALSKGIEAVSQLQVAAVRAMAGGRLTPAGQQEIVAADTGITEALQTFGDLGPSDWPALLNSRLGGPAVVQAERLQSLVTRSQPGRDLALGTDVRGWSAAMGARIELMHTVEAEVDGRLLGAVTAERDAERRAIFVAVVAVAVLLLVVVVVGVVVARSLTRSLTRLQHDAIDVAEHRLPQMVGELDVDNADPARVERVLAAAATPVRVEGTDEVASVAAAFNKVTSAAVRIAGEQAATRAGVGAILVALSRRLQRRADAMMVSLDRLERDERDPERLASLFQLDHTATLIRRLIFNLRILAGGRGGSTHMGSVTLPDLLRAAEGEIDDYTRVRTTAVDDGVRIDGEVAAELIHLLAELLDNATQFSPPESTVEVEARQVGDQLHIQIRDDGVGMTQAGVKAARHRIANPPMDHQTAERMGLPVVGMIAGRLGIKIEVRAAPHRGTRVDLTIPGALFAAVPVAVRAPAELSAAVVSGPPATWPLVAGTATVEPVIFNQVSTSRSAWFDPTALPDPAAVTAELVPVGAAAGRHAIWTEAALAGQATEGGLPVRQPGQHFAAHLTLQRQQASPGAASVQRDPDRLRQQMSGFQSGLGQAGRRSTTISSKDVP